MAIEINEMKLPITPIQARDILQRHTDNFGVFIDIERVCEHEFKFSRHMHKLYPEFRSLAGNMNLEVTKTKEIIDIYKKRFGIPDYKLINKDKIESCDKFVRDNLLEDTTLSQDARRFVELHDSISKDRYFMSYMGQYKNLPLSDAVSFEGHRMGVARPLWELLATSRISAKNPSIQNIARETPDIITYPMHYILMRSDSGQIEPRINFSWVVRDALIRNLIIAYNDAYYGILHYVQLTDAEEAIYREDFSRLKLHEITPELKEKRQTIKTLTNAGSYGSMNLQNVDRGLAEGFTKKIVNHPLRRQLEAEVRHDVENGVETFYGAFGTPVTPEETTKYKKGTTAWKGHLVRCGINNPIQTTASELMIWSVYTADKILSKAKDSHICYYKHDEGAFLIHEDEDYLIKELDGVNAYNVKGWIPIEAEAEFGIKGAH